MIPYNASLNTSIDDWTGNGGLFKYFNIGVLYILKKKNNKKDLNRWNVALSKDMLGIK
jgi:hypothetical protein